jgi:hypothetical protein
VFVADPEDGRTPPFRTILEAVLDPAFPFEPLVHLAIPVAIGYAFGSQFLRKVVESAWHAAFLVCRDSYTT